MGLAMASNGAASLGLQHDHIGLIVGDLASGMAQLGLMFGRVEWTAEISDPIQKVDMRFGRTGDGLVYELLVPNADNSPLAASHRKRKNMLNHICYRTPDLCDTVDRLSAIGVRAFTEAAPAIAYGGDKVQFLMHPDGWIMELVEGDVSPFDIWPREQRL